MVRLINLCKVQTSNHLNEIIGWDNFMRVCIHANVKKDLSDNKLCKKKLMSKLEQKIRRVPACKVLYKKYFNIKQHVKNVDERER